ncbi:MULTISPECIES: PAQR family membrane homeostasis protein TrhA [Clostridia]|jgi:hemolysin III|uniref:Hemolysin III n=1 Tax=Clostridium disporicum TaxID=84024 RepID=A0A174IBK4_9CLOT|nr:MULTISPECIES: hemolysin III family protein [Clostridia]MDU6341558.1 hemolysin III family protein [Clostridium sp.]MBC5625829.1 hemolysin III family protein [Clostridium sp. NSJ-49]MCD2503120.1 hemolysin III family protein [Clostridium sp. NSJ-145]MDY3958426.1 hemolysin III family protein [Romboutsia timonensis]CUO83516.1 hemolysin III [Clostridium disporicum]
MKQEKEKRKKQIKALNEPPKLTILEEVGNAVVHGIGAGLAIAGFILLLLKSDTGLKVMASCFYGISLFLLMIMSTLYHAFKSGSKVKRLWRRFDYCSIYLLIGGTFAPLYLVYWGNTLGIIIFSIQWALIVLGIVMISVFGPGRFKWLHFSLYFIIGWSGLVFLPDWFHNNRPLMWMILIGGVVYTVGMIPFTKDKKYSHFIWHFFVMIGAILHWIGIYYYIY